MQTLLLFLLLVARTSFGTVVDVVTFFDIADMQIDDRLIKSAGYELRSHVLEPYEQALLSGQQSPDQIQVWNYVLAPTSPVFMNPSKRIYFLWEPWEPDLSYYSLYNRVYTWNDDLVDNAKFFKIHYPSLMPMLESVPSFEDKKFCTMVAGNWTQPRVKVVEFFEEKPDGDFEFYGRYQFGSRNYRGAIPGFHSGNAKLQVLKNYRFCICFENSTHLRGYVTEKIFCCFAAGCVPVYWGAPNVEMYIPKSCYVDFRDFPDTESLYQHLKAMPKEVYDHYLEEIRAFLDSPQAQVFSPAHFNKVLLESLQG